MRLIPDVIYDRDRDPVSKGERHVFELLKNVDFFHHAVALHSLNLMGNSRQQMFEIDFLVITQRGIVGIEVKGAEMRCKDGVYYFGGANGYQKRVSPYVQVSNAIEHLRTHGMATFGLEMYKKALFGKVAILTENYRPNASKGDTPEMPDKAVIYKDDLFDVEKFSKALDGALKFAEEALGHKLQLAKRDISTIAYKLRPSFDVASCSVSAVNTMLEKQESFTSDQYIWLDLLSNMDRAIVDGGAGTGKTFLLEQLVKREVDKGRSVLVCTASKLLSEKIKQSVGDIAQIICFSRGICRGEEKYDVVMVDEGQDLFNEDFIDYLDEVVVRGLQFGRWRWFADFENQRGLGVDFDADIFDFVREATGNSTIVPLCRNVRNTPNIVNWLKQVCRARIDESEAFGSGPEVKSISRCDFDKVIQGRSLDSQIGSIEKDNLVHLYVGPEPDDLSRKAIEAGVPSFSIESFKGLESPFVVISGLGDVDTVDDFKQMAYKSVSRGRYLSLIVDEGNIIDFKLKAIDG